MGRAGQWIWGLWGRNYGICRPLPLFSGLALPPRPLRERVETSFSLSWSRGMSLPWEVRAPALPVVEGDMPKEMHIVSKFQRSSTGNCFLFFSH